MSQIGIIPHAGIKYSGMCRKKVFQKLKKTNKIIYVVNDHHGVGNYAFHSLNVKNREKWISSVEYSREHSYFWVIEEIEKYFNISREKVNSYMIGKKWLLQKDKILELLVKHIKEGGVVIFTVDLTHFGDTYNFNNLPEPIIYGKYKFEEKLILGLLNGDYKLVEEELRNKPNLSCSHLNLIVSTYLVNRLGLNGRVIEYYDSSNIGKNYKKYIIFPNIKLFVSYVGIVFYRKKNTSIYKIDSQMVLAFLRSSIELKQKFELPKWSVWYHKKNGVFLQTEYKTKKNCCIGEYENETSSTADFINNLSLGCINDAENRWKFPYTGLNFDKLKYEMELLQSKKKWKTKKAKKLKLKPNNPYGIYLTSNNKSSTFLPYVWRDDIPDANTIEELLDILSGKAIGQSKNKAWRDDPSTKVELYTSKKYSSF